MKKGRLKKAASFLIVSEVLWAADFYDDYD